MLLLRGGNEPYAEMTPEQAQAALQRYRDWAQKLQSENRLIETNKLDSTGARLVKKSGSIQVDGPFTETKESIGGYFTVIADNEAEAVQIAQQCPIFNTGGYIEIRQIQN
jgi:hypothetical protein